MVVPSSAAHDRQRQLNDSCYCVVSVSCVHHDTWKSLLRVLKNFEKQILRDIIDILRCFTVKILNVVRWKIIEQTFREIVDPTEVFSMKSVCQLFIQKTKHSHTSCDKLRHQKYVIYFPRHIRQSLIFHHISTSSPKKQILSNHVPQKTNQMTSFSSLSTLNPKWRELPTRWNLGRKNGPRSEGFFACHSGPCKMAKK